MADMTMRVPRWALAGTAAAALLSGGRPAMAAEPGQDALPINVIAIQTSDADDQAEALTKALRVAVRSTPGWSLADGDYSLEVLALSLKCSDPPDATCQSRIADQIKSDRYVWGSIKKKGANVAGDVHLWVRGKGTSNWALDYSANLTEAGDDSLKRIASEAVTQLTGGPPKGGIHVHAGTVAGQVFIDGQLAGTLQAGEGTFAAGAGAHKVLVKAPGYLEMETQVMVKAAGVPTEVSPAMVPTGAGTPLDWKKIGGYGAIGLGAVFAIVGFASMGQVASAQSAVDQVRKAPGPNSKEGPSFDWCNPTVAAQYSISDACSKGHTFQTMEIVFFPLAAVAAGAGIYLVVTSNKTPPKTGLMVSPQLGPGAGKIDLSYTW